MSEHKAIVTRLCAEKYKDTRVIYWAGSVTTGNYTTQNKWQANGKAIIQYLKKENYDLAETYRDAFDEVFKRNHTQQLEVLVKKILEPYGGLLWEGYRADAPSEWKK